MGFVLIEMGGIVVGDSLSSFSSSFTLLCKESVTEDADFIIGELESAEEGDNGGEHDGACSCGMERDNPKPTAVDVGGNKLGGNGYPGKGGATPRGPFINEGGIIPPNANGLRAKSGEEAIRMRSNSDSCKRLDFALLF